MATADRLLLDTHAFIWAASAPEQLGRDALRAIETPSTDLVLSIASIWEMAIKSSLGKLDLGTPLDAFLRQQLSATRTCQLDIRGEHAGYVAGLPFHHRDPFDRLLVAQASVEGMAIVSRDTVFEAYGVARIW